MKAYKIELENGKRMSIITSQKDVAALIWEVFLMEAVLIEEL